MKTYSKPTPKIKKNKLPVVVEKPEINLTLSPVIEVVAPAADMSPIAEAIKQMMPSPNTHKEDHKDKPRQIEIDVVERDGRGFIKKLICTELTDV
jgi:hypothetical protein